MLRFAPSPTGDMHISNLRVAILNYVVSQQKKSQFLIRIEDSDKAKNIEGKDTEIMMILEKFALKHDSVYHQSEHLNIHQSLAIRLLKEGKAFICKCTDEDLEAAREVAKKDGITYRYNNKCENLSHEDYKELQEKGEPFVIRLKKPEHDEIDSFVIMRADNTPTHNFACACDDMLSSVDFVIRGEEHLSSTRSKSTRELQSQR